MITLISHIYNEEYLLPFWLKHHKNIVQHGIIIDYESSDKSVKIIKDICPSWTIIQSRYKNFDCINCDKEVMDIEKTINNGYKICLNTTEFLVCETTINTLLLNEPNQCIKLAGLSLLSKTNVDYYNPQTLKELFDGIEFINYTNRSSRFLHSYTHGDYTCGRHSSMTMTNNKISIAEPIYNDVTNDNFPAFICCFSYFPWNENFIKRKLNVKTKMTDESRRTGLGYHHLWDINDMINARNECLNKDVYPISSFPKLLDLISKIL